MAAALSMRRGEKFGVLQKPTLAIIWSNMLVLWVVLYNLYTYNTIPWQGLCWCKLNYMIIFFEFDLKKSEIRTDAKPCNFYEHATCVSNIFSSFGKDIKYSIFERKFNGPLYCVKPLKHNGGGDRIRLVILKLAYWRTKKNILLRIQLRFSPHQVYIYFNHNL